jgi:hypothetical protein
MSSRQNRSLEPMGSSSDIVMQACMQASIKSSGEVHVGGDRRSRGHRSSGRLSSSWSGPGRAFGGRTRNRLREHAVAALGAVLTYRRRTADESDRKVLALVAESGQLNARVVRLMLDLDPSSTSRLLGDMVARGLLVKTSRAEAGSQRDIWPRPRVPNREAQVQPLELGPAREPRPAARPWSR